MWPKTFITPFWSDGPTLLVLNVVVGQSILTASIFLEIGISVTIANISFRKFMGGSNDL